ncbi:MAG: ribosomal protein L7/L12 [Lachnospiraceae bacterium]|nr:ribosomal protein L7/L12 [Lachnospiraceae bacterium]
MEKILVIITCCVLLAVCLSACGKKSTGANTSTVPGTVESSTSETVESTSNEVSEVASSEATETASNNTADETTATEEVIYQVELTAIGSDKFSVIDTYRKLSGLGLKEAKDLVNTAPFIMLTTNDSDEANQYKTSLEAVGATVTIIDETGDVVLSENTEPATDNTETSEAVSTTGGTYAVDRVFSIKDAGTVFTGTIQEGSIKMGDSAVIILEDGTEIPVTINRIEVFGSFLEEAEAGQNVGIGFAEAIEKDSVLTAKTVLISAE